MRYLYTGIIVLGLLLSACGGDDVSGPEPEPPTPDVDFTFSPQNPEAGAEVSFSGEVNEGSSEITSWEWNFGDANQSTATGQNVTFTYENSGSYDVVLTASDDNGNSDEVEKNISVAEGEFQAAVVWSYDTGNLVPEPNDATSPAIADDGTVYYVESSAGADSKVISVTDNGDNASLNWETATGADMRQAPAIGLNGNIYIGNFNAELVKLSDTGDILWAGNTDGEIYNSTVAIDADGLIYATTRGAGHDGGVLSFKPDGTERWERSDVAWIQSSPALSNDGNSLYIFVTNKGFVHSYTTNDATRNWAHGVTEGLGTSMSVDSDGTIYLTTDTEIIALADSGDAAGTKWVQGGDTPSQSGVVVGPNDDLYVGSKDGLISLNPADGSVNWIYDQITVEESVPAVDSEGNIYIGSNDGRFSIIDPSGQLLKEFTLGTNIVNSPVIADDGTVYVEAAEADGDSFIIKLHKITVEVSTGPAGSNWPMKGKNRKNTAH